MKEIFKNALSLICKISPKLCHTILYIYRTKQIPHYKNPKNFNDITSIVKLNNYNNNDLVYRCTDKYEVRQYILNLNLKEIINDIYGVYEKYEDINFDILPEKFVIKCTHGCGYNIIINDKTKMDKKEIENKLKKWMNEKYGYATAELHYTRIKPRIIIEKYLCDENDKMPLDYKIYCFNGKAKCILVCSERDEKLRLSYYDMNWNRLNYEKKSWSSNKSIKKPKNLKKMIEYAEKLSGNFPFVRVDFYNDNGKIIFGELTFTPACCCAPYYSHEGNTKLKEYFNE